MTDRLQTKQQKAHDYALIWTHRHDPKQGGKVPITATDAVDACKKLRQHVMAEHARLSEDDIVIIELQEDFL